MWRRIQQLAQTLSEATGEIVANTVVPLIGRAPSLLPIAEIRDTILNRPIPEVPRLIPEAAESGMVESYDGTPIFWERHGPDPAQTSQRPMVFCYGLVCSMNQWRIQLERYRQQHPCLLVDYRGHHKSGSPDSLQRMNVASLAKDVSAAISAARLNGPVQLWGHSMGCNVALELALAEPQRVRSMVLLCGTANNPSEDMFHNKSLEDLLLRFFKGYPQTPETYRLLWQSVRHFPQITHRIAALIGFNSQAAHPKDAETYSLSVANIQPSTFFPLAIELSKGLTFAFLPKIQTPTLVISGALDRITPPLHQKRMAEALPLAEYIEIPAGSHNVQIDFGEYVAMKVEEYWQKNSLL